MPEPRLNVPSSASAGTALAARQAASVTAIFLCISSSLPNDYESLAAGPLRALGPLRTLDLLGPLDFIRALDLLGALDLFRPLVVRHALKFRIAAPLARCGLGFSRAHRVAELEAFGFRDL